MTASLVRPSQEQNIWGAMPGWGITADLTPPEMVHARQLRVLRRQIAAALVLVLVLCGAGYAYAMMKTSSAQDDANAASAQTTQLQIAGKKYSGVTEIENAVSSIKGQVQSAMGTDVDLPTLLARIRGSLPGTMSIQNLSITLTGTSVSAPSTQGLDISANPQIGTATIAGVAQSLDDLPAFVDKLSAISGVINVIPSSNQASNTAGAKSRTVQFSVNLALTSALYSHKYDATKGAK